MQLEAIYYAAPAPTSMRSLTLLGLVFDRIIFPGVHIPMEGVDKQGVLREVARLRGLGIRDVDDASMINCMLCAANCEFLKDFCCFSGRPGVMGVLEAGAEEFAKTLEQSVWGAPQGGFVPSYTFGFAKALPGDGTISVNGPCSFAYPANAFLASVRSGTVLINDNPELPVPACGSLAPRSDAKHLSTILALETVKLLLPTFREMSFEELAEFRAETRDLVRPFRNAMLRLSKELNAAILSSSSLKDITREAKFLAETTVLPELDDLRAELSRPMRPWYRRIVALAQQAPELVGAFATMPLNLAVAKLLGTVAGALADIQDERLEKDGIAKRGGFHYLLRMDAIAR